MIYATDGISVAGFVAPFGKLTIPPNRAVASRKFRRPVLSSCHLVTLPPLRPFTTALRLAQGPPQCRPAQEPAQGRRLSPCHLVILSPAAGSRFDTRGAQPLQCRRRTCTRRRQNH